MLIEPYKFIDHITSDMKRNYKSNYCSSFPNTHFIAKDPERSTPRCPVEMFSPEPLLREGKRHTPASTKAWPFGLTNWFLYKIWFEKKGIRIVQLLKQ